VFNIERIARPAVPVHFHLCFTWNPRTSKDLFELYPVWCTSFIKR